MNLRWTAFVLAATCSTAVMAAARQQVVPAQGPARDAAVPPTPKGTAEISGVVVTNDGGSRPLRMATVKLSGGGLPQRPITVTDEEGRFNFGELPAGRYTLSALKAGYIEMEYGAKRPGASGMPIVIGDGSRTNITMMLPKAAAISGIVTGPDGEPVSNARVMIFEPQLTSRGGRELEPPRSLPGWRWQLMTDDRGAYRFYGMPAGEYYVTAQPHFTWDFSAGSARALSAADFDWARSLLQPAGMSASTPPPAPRQMSYATVYYPGSIEPDGAAPIKVSAGEDRTGIDFALQFVPTATISGTILGPDGRPPKGVQATMLVQSMSVFVREPVGIRPDAEGRFTASGVLPGDYVLAARGALSTAGAESNVMPYWAMMDVRVDGRDIPDLDVRLQPGVNVSGRLVFNGAAARPSDVKTVRVSLSPTYDSVMMAAAESRVAADGTFAISGVAPGRYRMSASVPTPTGGTAVWTTRSAMVGGQDALDFPFEVRHSGISDVVVTFTDRPTEISGTLFDANDRPTPQFFIVVFPTDRSFWMQSSRRIRSARPGNTGSYRITGLPPGEYYVAAVTDFDSAELYSAPFLESLVSAAFKITLAEGQKVGQDLKAGTPGTRNFRRP